MINRPRNPGKRSPLQDARLSGTVQLPPALPEGHTMQRHAILSAVLAFLLAKPIVAADALPDKLAPYFHPPAELAKDFGSYRSPLLFADGSPVKTAADWQKRRQQILKEWHDLMGPWPELVAKPKVE